LVNVHVRHQRGRVGVNMFFFVNFFFIYQRGLWKVRKAYWLGWLVG